MALHTHHRAVRRLLKKAVVKAEVKLQKRTRRRMRAVHKHKATGTNRLPKHESRSEGQPLKRKTYFKGYDNRFETFTQLA